MRPKRAGPTIDLEATEVSSGDVQNTADAGARPGPTFPSSHRHPRWLPGGDPLRSPAPAPPHWCSAPPGSWGGARLQAAPRATDGCGRDRWSRHAGSPASSPKPACRHLRQPPLPMRRRPRASKRFEKSSASLRGELASARAQSEKLAALVNEIDVGAARVVASAARSVCRIDERLAQIESATRAQGATRDRAGEAGQYQAGR